MSFDNIENFQSMKIFDDFLKDLSYYHVEKCVHETCSRCVFAVNLRYLHNQNIVQQSTSVEPLIIFCQLRIHQFNCTLWFINTLGQLKKQRVVAENEFHKTLALSNKSPQPPLAPEPEK